MVVFLRYALSCFEKRQLILLKVAKKHSGPPCAKEIDKMERVVYEYLEIAWTTLRGQINPQNLIEPRCLNRVKRNGPLLNAISFYQIENSTQRSLGKQPKQQ
jgi:hypothetical protein